VVEQEGYSLVGVSDLSGTHAPVFYFSVDRHGFVPHGFSGDTGLGVPVRCWVSWRTGEGGAGEDLYGPEALRLLLASAEPGQVLRGLFALERGGVTDAEELDGLVDGLLAHEDALVRTRAISVLCHMEAYRDRIGELMLSSDPLVRMV